MGDGGKVMFRNVLYHHELDSWNDRLLGERTEAVEEMATETRDWKLRDWMRMAFWWRDADPDFTADEIASMAADGFPVDAG